MSARVEVSIAAYGAVLGSVAGGASLEVALAEARIDARAWPEADARWAAAIVDDEALAEAFERAFVEARDARYRPPAPLDEVDGYVGFVEALARAESPVAWAAAKQLTIDDLALVQAHWARRLRAEPELGDVLRARLRVALPEPEVAATPRAAARPPAVAAPAPAGDEPGDDDAGEATPSLPDVLAAAMPEPAAVASPPPGETRRPASSPPRDPGRGDEPLPPPAPAVVVERVVPSFMLAPVAPVAPSTSPVVIADAPPAAAPPAPAFRRSKLGATMMGVVLPARPATPFERPAPGPSVAAGDGARPAATTGTVVASADAGQVTPDERAGLERYAAICADLAAKAEPRPAILARYGLDESSKKALDQRWEQLFQTNGTARVVWMEALAAHRRASRVR